MKWDGLARAPGAAGLNAGGAGVALAVLFLGFSDLTGPRVNICGGVVRVWSERANQSGLRGRALPGEG